MGEEEKGDETDSRNGTGSVRFVPSLTPPLVLKNTSLQRPKVGEDGGVTGEPLFLVVRVYDSVHG